MEMKSPVGQNIGVVIFRDGTTAAPDANGNINVPSAFVSDMLGAGFTPFVPNTYSYSTDSGSTQALTAAMVAGADAVYHLSTGGATPALTTPTAAVIVAGIANVVVGMKYRLRVLNSNSGTATLAAGTGVTITGTATLATGTWTDFIVNITSLTAVALQNAGSGTVV